MRALLFLHLCGVAFWLGGQLLLVTTVLPALRHLPDPDRRELVRKVGQRYGVLSIPILLLVLVTGALMAASYDMSPGDSSALRAKLLAVAVVIAATIVHSVAAAQAKRGVSRGAAFVGLAATVVAVWFATGI